MEHKERITTEDLRLAKEDWSRDMAQNLKNIQREPVNCDEEAQANLMNYLFRKINQ